MRVLLHICCANCAIYPLERMKEKGDDVTGYFFNPNIHPFQEYQKRLDALKQYSEKVGLNVIYRDEYLLEEFLKNVSHQVKERCQYCYKVRLEATACEAKNKGFDRIFNHPSPKFPSKPCHNQRNRRAYRSGGWNSILL